MAADVATAAQGELTLLPPDPWNGATPEAPAGAMRPDLVAVDAEGARGPGRPPGRPNNRADTLTTYIATRYGSPLEHAARLFAKPVAELAREMGVRGIIAAQHKLAVGKLLARYIEAAPAKPVLMAARMTNVLGEQHYQAATTMSEVLASRHDQEKAQGKELAEAEETADASETAGSSNVVLLPGLPPRAPD